MNSYTKNFLNGRHGHYFQEMERVEKMKTWVVSQDVYKRSREAINKESINQSTNQ